MKSEQEIKNKIEELNIKIQQAFEERDLDYVLRLTALVRSLMWVLKEK